MVFPGRNKVARFCPGGGGPVLPPSQGSGKAHESNHHTMPETILLIEDEADVSDLVRYHLRKAKYRVLTAADGAEGLSLASMEAPDAIILDIMLPKFSGFEVARRLRAEQRTASIPLLMLSAKGETENRIKGLELGADDYLPKPFSPRELLLRLQAMLRRNQRPDEQESAAGPFVVDRNSLKVTLDGERLDLTSTEFKLLSLLIGKSPNILSREDLLLEVWGYKNTVDTRTVDTHMRRLREKLGDHSSYIETIRGEGYRFNPPLVSA
jgi:two-component system phosphate regulon response regulator PhoB